MLEVWRALGRGGGRQEVSKSPWLRRSVQSRDTMIGPAAVTRLAAMVELATMCFATHRPFLPHRARLAPVVTTRDHGLGR